jgi:hypothetical protein
MYRRLRPFAAAKRKVAHELCVLSIGDEASAAFGVSVVIRRYLKWVAIVTTSFAAGSVASAFMAEADWQTPKFWISATLSVVSVGLWFGGPLLAHGFQQGFMALDAEMGVAPAPAGPTVDFLTPLLTIRQGQKSDKWNRHSSPCYSPETIDQVADWIAKKLRTTPPTTRPQTSALRGPVD